KAKPTAENYYEVDPHGNKLPAEKGYLAFTGFFPPVAGLDGARAGVLLGDPGENNGKGKTLETEITNYTSKGGKLEDNPPQDNLDKWWKEEGKPNDDADFAVIEAARLHGGK